MELFNDTLLNSWRSFGDWGFILVIWGVIGEVLAATADFIAEKLFKAWHDKRRGRFRLAEIVSGGVLILGLAMEYRGHKKETHILDSYSAQLNLEATQAGQEGEKAKRSAAEANEAAEKAKTERALVEKQAEEFRSNNLVLESNVLALQITLEKTKNVASNALSSAAITAERLKNRHLTETQKEKILHGLESIPKGKVRVVTMNSTDETKEYKSEFVKLLGDAKFLTANAEIGPSFGFTPYDGVQFCVYDRTNPPTHAMIFRIFKEAGVDCTGAQDRKVAPDVVEIHIGNLLVK